MNQSHPPTADASSPGRVAELVVNLDDTTPEVIGQAVDALLAEGALDAWTTPIGMKKNRPGVMLSVLCREEDRARTAERVLRLTGSFGVRHRVWDRTVLDRAVHTLQTRLGEIEIKVGSRDGRAVVAQPEWASVLEAADRKGITPRETMAAATAAADDWLAKQEAGAEA